MTKKLIWKPEEDEILKARWNEGKRKLAGLLNKSIMAIYTRGLHFGLYTKEGKEKKVKIILDVPKSREVPKKKETKSTYTHPAKAFQCFGNDGKGISLVSIERHQCHWPCGNVYCGAEGVNKPHGWCPEHFRIGWQPQRARK